MFANSIMILAAYIVIAFCLFLNKYKAAFYISLLSSIMFGMGSALGESTTLGYCKGFPSNVVGFFSSGTGFAGIFGSGIILLLKGAGLDDAYIFLIVGPTVVPYFLSFLWLHKTKLKHHYI